MKVRWAPFSVPLERRLQTLSVFLLLAAIVVSILLSLVSIFVPLTWPFFMVYLGYMYWDRETASEGGRPQETVRIFRETTKRWFSYYSDYFPAQLIVGDQEEGTSLSAGLIAGEKYLFSIHPHGWIGCGIWATFLSEGCSISSLLPGLKFRAVTLKTNFFITFWRDFVLGQGLCDCSAKSISNIFSKGLSVLVVPGGARESLYARPSDTISLVLEKRCGFVRVAIENGAHLVPVYGFGEERLYDQVDNTPGTMLRRVQDYLLNRTGIAFPLVKGRGVFNYSFGFLPQRKPITVIVGNPIKTPHCPNPTPEMIKKVHDQYKEELKRLFEANKGKYGYATQQLEYV